MYSYEHNLRDAGLANPELRPYLDWYIRGHNIGAAEKARLFRLTWSLAGDNSGSRQELYKRWHRERIRQLLCRLDPLGKAHGTARAGW